ncbi:MAG: family 43 glycosylhydrolase [Akkermansiaceae bacterium]|nr:family 43 glycosylhydrolase [Akkermansiaceae bacterium]
MYLPMFPMTPKLPLLFAVITCCASAAPRPTKSFHSDGNPILGDGSYFSADAAPLSVDGKLYIYAGHDEPPPEVGGFVMYDYGVFVTEDPESGDWELYTDNLDPDKVFDWASGNRAYAGHCAKGLDGRFYWYVPVEWKNNDVPNNMAIGVAVSDGPLGPWKDPIGKPLVTWKDVFGEEKHGQEVIDPHLFIDDDKTAYLYWGSWGAARVVKLDGSMTALDGEITTMTGLEAFYEAPWVFKRNGTYYLVYDWKLGGTKFTPSNYQAAIAYATSSSPTGPWKTESVILWGTSSTTVHPSIIEHGGKWWITYHTKDAETGGHFRRSVAIDEVKWDGDKILPVEQTWANPPKLKLTNNLALDAALTASFSEEPPMSLAALHDGRPPVVRLPPDMWSTYRGNESKVESDWAQYTWDLPVPISGVGIMFHQDPNWHRPPAEWKLEYQDPGGAWREVEGAKYPTDADKWITVDFKPIVTKALRATFMGQPEGDYFHSMIASEWEVYSPPADKLPSGRIATKVGEAPKLPETVKLSFDKLGTLPVPIDWKSIPPARYAKPGTFKAEGKAAGQDAGYVTLEVKVTR